MAGDRRTTHASATANYHYITRTAGADARGRIDFRHRDDLVAHGLELPLNHPNWAAEDGRIWREIDAATAEMPADAVRAWHVVVSLPPERDSDDWIAMVRAYANDIASVGPAVAWAIHFRPDGTCGGIPPHVHLLITTRHWRHDANHGKTVPRWCGPAMRQQLHGQWLLKLPEDMRRRATSGYQVGSIAAARPDCSALADLFGRQPPKSGEERSRRIRRRPSHRIRKERKCPSEGKGK